MWIKDREVIEEKNDAAIEALEQELDDLIKKLMKNEGSDCLRRMNIISAPFYKKISKLSKEQKMERPIHLDGDIPDYGDRMSVEDFKSHVECGGFVDSDGYGTYILDDKMSNIDIVPSDVKTGAIRNEFTEIIWFNK